MSAHDNDRQQGSQDAAQGRRAAHDDLRRRTIAHMRAGTTDLTAGSVAIDPRVYTDAARGELERRELFQRRPILAALSGDLPNAGDKMLFDVLGPAILLVRNREGRVNAFLNMCTHRAARLVEGCDARTRMTCRFHGWTFDLDGHLVGLPGPEGFSDLAREHLSLVPVPVAEWHGLIFVRATPGGEPIDVAGWLGPMGDELKHLELDRAVPARSESIPAACNWKYAFDTYGENYHFATLHPGTIGALAYSNMMTATALGRHHRIGFPRAEFKPYADAPESEWPPTDYGGLYMIFPNAVINVNSLPGGGQFYGLSRVFPDATPAACTTLMTHYRPAHADPALPMSKWIDMHEFVRSVVTNEDYGISAAGQRNLQYAPQDFTLRFGANEGVLQRQHAEIERILDEATARSSTAHARPNVAT